MTRQGTNRCRRFYSFVLDLIVIQQKQHWNNNKNRINSQYCDRDCICKCTLLKYTESSSAAALWHLIYKWYNWVRTSPRIVLFINLCKLKILCSSFACCSCCSISIDCADGRNESPMALSLFIPFARVCLLYDNIGMPHTIRKCLMCIMYL